MDTVKVICETGCESERLYFRKLQKVDVEDMFEYTSNEKTCRFLKWEPYEKREQAEAFINEKRKIYECPADILFAIELKKEKKMIGVIRIYNIIDNAADISYIQNELFCGRGYMTEAVRKMIEICFKKLKLCKVQCYFVEGNTASERVMKNSGMILDREYEQFDLIKGKKLRLYRYKIENGD